MKTNPTPQELIDLAADEHLCLEHKTRVEKVIKLRNEGIESWPASKPVDATCKQVIDEYTAGNEGKEYSLAGRLMTIRLHGKTAFADLQDRTGRLQIYIRKDEVSNETFDLIQHSIDLGDIVWVKGFSFVTKMGEITVHVEEFALLSKCLYPLPEKFHGLTDIETIYRQRYLDLITNQRSSLKVY